MIRLYSTPPMLQSRQHIRPSLTIAKMKYKTKPREIAAYLTN